MGQRLISKTILPEFARNAQKPGDTYFGGAQLLLNLNMRTLASFVIDLSSINP